MLKSDMAPDDDIVMGDSQGESTKHDVSVTVNAMPGGLNGNRIETPYVGPNGTNGVQGGTSSIGTPGREARQPWEYVEEIVAILKTAFPLLALTLETIQDQLKQRFKPSNEEDSYRILSNAVAAGLNVCFDLRSLLTELTCYCTEST